MSAKYNQLKKLVESVLQDVDRFYNKENQSAGTRVRKAMQEVKTLAQEIRIEVQEAKNRKG